MAPRRTCHKQAVPVRGGYDGGFRTMQASARAAHRRSLTVSDRLQERLPVPVLGLELAARQHPGAASPGIASADADQAVAGRGRRALMLAVCCMSLFMVGLDNTIVNGGLPAIGRDLHAGVS